MVLSVLRKGVTAQNPAFDLVPDRFGKHNTVSSFITQFGPIREVRFKYHPDGTRDGSIDQLYVTTGLPKIRSILLVPRSSRTSPPS